MTIRISDLIIEYIRDKKNVALADICVEAICANTFPEFRKGVENKLLELEETQLLIDWNAYLDQWQPSLYSIAHEREGKGKRHG